MFRIKPPETIVCGLGVELTIQLQMLAAMHAQVPSAHVRNPVIKLVVHVHEFRQARKAQSPHAISWKKLKEHLLQNREKLPSFGCLQAHLRLAIPLHVEHVHGQIVEGEFHLQVVSCQLREVLQDAATDSNGEVACP